MLQSRSDGDANAGPGYRANAGPPMRSNLCLAVVFVWIYSDRHDVHHDVGRLVTAMAAGRDVKGAVAVVSISVTTTWRANYAS